jgi:L-ascorbate metabolism protein UlaG (beta-lactamase superfamily)
MRLTLLRNATILLEHAHPSSAASPRGSDPFGSATLLVDPMLADRGANGTIPGTAPPVPNPLVALPRPAEEVAAAATHALVTHLHQDHFDAAAQRLLPDALPIACAPAHVGGVRGGGFTDVAVIEDRAAFAGFDVTRVAARHALDEHEGPLGPVSGYVLRADGAPCVHVASDCVWCPELAEVISTERPDVIVVNAGGARFTTGGPITMTAEDVIAVARHCREALVVAVHLEALNHCPLTRDALARTVAAAAVEDRVVIPADGECLAL